MSESLQQNQSSLSDLISNLKYFVDSGDTFQLGQVLGYCILKGLSDFKLSSDYKTAKDVKLNEMKSIYSCTESVVTKLSEGLPVSDLTDLLEETVDKTLTESKKNIGATDDRSVLFKNIIVNMNTNKGSYSGRIAWSGRVLCGLIDEQKKPYRATDVILQDYDSIRDVFVKTVRYYYKDNEA